MYLFIIKNQAPRSYLLLTIEHPADLFITNSQAQTNQPPHSLINKTVRLIVTIQNQDCPKRQFKLRLLFNHRYGQNRSWSKLSHGLISI